MGVFDKNAGKPGTRPNLWIRYYVRGEEIREPGKGSQKATAAYLAELRRQIKAGTWVHPRDRRGTGSRFDSYARSVIVKRIARGVATANKDERGHVEQHLVPVFGALEMRELTFKRIADGFEQRINSKGLAGRTVRNIHSTLRAILRQAVRDEVIDHLPMPLSVKDDDLPPPIDKLEGWRDGAKFEGSEIRKLLALDSVPSIRRVMYVTYFLTGARFSELLDMRVRHYQRDRGPLRALSIHAAKVGRHRGLGRKRREVPVHPELQAWLDWWLADEYEVLYGHEPEPDDLLFPTISEVRRRRGFQTCSHNEIYKQWRRNDLPGAKLRHRKLHDARRTLLSALKNAGVPDDLRRKITHHSVEDRVLDAYTIWEWETLCEAMRRVRWELPTPGGKARKVVRLRPR